VARRSAESRATVPDLDLSVTARVDAAVALERELGCGLTALWVRACALALRDHPTANAAYRDGRFERYDRVNIGVVIAAPDTYAVPTVFDADTKSAAELGSELADLDARARAGSLLAPELSGATFTLSDVGSLGIERATPVIVPPQAAGITTGCVQHVPIVRNGDIVTGQTMNVTLACDHRILYGAAAAAFLTTFRDNLEEAML
jgi:pyruvate dehydrogenase E2 component (dihydrolipoamide acetyltransferase)